MSHLMMDLNNFVGKRICERVVYIRGSSYWDMKAEREKTFFWRWA